jgi:hypothetical protein
MPGIIVRHGGRLRKLLGAVPFIDGEKHAKDLHMTPENKNPEASRLTSGFLNLWPLS